MHFVFSYDLSVEAGPRRNEIERQIIDCLPTGQFSRQLNNFYIVRINDDDEWNAILVNMTNISRTIPETLYFIMTPPTEQCSMNSRYNGMLPVGSWQQINELTLNNN